MDIGPPFIKLPFSFDAERIKEEALALPGDAWAPHPSGMAGNSAVLLIARDGEENDEFDGLMAPTRHLGACPYTRQVMASFGEVFGRSRFMRLAPGAEVSAHVDFNYHWLTRVRIHVPVVTDPGVIFHCGPAKVHMGAGECWIFNSWRRHRVVNASKVSRIHLVLDTAGSSRFWRMVDQADALACTHIAFDADAQAEVRTERYNTAPVMAPGELDALVEGLVRDFSSHAGNDARLVARYALMLRDLCKDWREVWHEHGYSQAGHAHYQALIDRLRSGLHANPRALVTSSNQLGVNPIIVQRILAPALAISQGHHFFSNS